MRFFELFSINLSQNKKLPPSYILRIMKTMKRKADNQLCLAIIAGQAAQLIYSG